MATIDSMFSSLKQPKDITNYALMRGVTDFTALEQWNMYETGYSFLHIVRMPVFLESLAKSNTEYANLLNTYKKIIEFEFRDISGLPDLSTDTYDITNNISTISLISKSTFESNITFNSTYYERSGSPLTRLTEMWIRGIKDPRTTFKHYLGLIEDGEEPDLAKETATFLYGVTDNTGLNLEKSFLITGIQPESAQFGDLYNITKATIENRELNLGWRGFVTYGRNIDIEAKKYLDYLNKPANENRVIKDETKFTYSQTGRIAEAVQ